jgi:hypothetical protein
MKTKETVMSMIDWQSALTLRIALMGRIEAVQRLYSGNERTCQIGKVLHLADELGIGRAFFAEYLEPLAEKQAGPDTD